MSERNRNKHSAKTGRSHSIRQAVVLTALTALMTAAFASFLVYMESRDEQALRTLIYVLVFVIWAAADIDASLSQRRRARRARLAGIDDMDGHDFEYWCADYLSQRGFDDVVVTRGSNDYGVDIVARFGDQNFAVQCKRCSYPVSNKAVQEVYTGRKMYECTQAAVITNNYFTDAAVKTAEKVNVKLWDRQWLEENALKIE